MATSFLTIEVIGNIHWPNQAVVYRYRDRDMHLRPETSTDAPTVTVELVNNESGTQARSFVYGFLSALSWATGEGSRLGLGIGSRHNPAGSVGKKHVRLVRGCNFDYAPETSTSKQTLALAIYREALFVNVEAYQLLGFYRIINLVAGKKGDEQVKWINKSLSNLPEEQSQKAIAAIRVNNSDVGKYLYVACRCAVAHASATQATINPDDIQHFRQMDEALPVVRSLAAHAIEMELGVPGVAAIRQRWKRGNYSNRV